MGGLAMSGGAPFLLAVPSPPRRRGGAVARQVERLAFSSLTFAREYTVLHEKIRARLSKGDTDKN